MPDKPKFRGFHSPNYTHVPDELFDELLADLSGAELKVLLYIIRRTFGFKKASDNISLSQITDGIVTTTGKRIDNGTGLVKSTATLAVKGLVEKNIILKVRNQSPGRGDMATTYALNLIPTPVQKSDPPVSGNQTPPGQKIGHPVGQKSDTQETVRQETVSNNVNVPHKTPSDGKTRPGRSHPSTPVPAISEPALGNAYGLVPDQVAEVRRLVQLEVDILGHAARNHAAYVQRAAEAVRDGTGHVLTAALGDVRDTSHRKAIGSLPAYFTRVYDAMREAYLRPAPVIPPTPTEPPSPATREDLWQGQRDRLLAAIAATGHPVPDHLRSAPLTALAAWYDHIEERTPATRP